MVEHGEGGAKRLDMELDWQQYCIPQCKNLMCICAYAYMHLIEATGGWEANRVEGIGGGK